jgi:probable O-glycosylation ligase (exosortase A-associated)
LVAASILAFVPAILIWPHVGILVWFWIGLMNPQRLTWGPLESFSYAAVVGGVTLLAWVLSREPKRVPATPVTVLLALFLVWISLTSLTAHLPGEVYSSWDQAFKIILLTFVTIALMQTRARLHALIWILVVSLGYYGLKGGVFTILHGGEYRVWGPPNTFIADNNQLGLALIMTLPFVLYLQRHSEVRWLRWGLTALGVAYVFAIIGTQSRGAFVSICVTGAYLVLKSNHRIPVGLSVIALALVAAMFVPDRWVERMETIQNYQEDESASQRIEAWTFSIGVALERPITGGGFNVFFDEDYYFELVPDAQEVRNFHSVYFEVLGEHGFVGLALFLGLLWATWLTFGRVIRLTRARDDLAWAQTIGRMGQVSLIGYATSGAFLNLAFYDLYYLIVAIAVVTRAVVEREIGLVASPATSRRAGPGRRDGASASTDRPGPDAPTGAVRQAPMTVSSGSDHRRAPARRGAQPTGRVGLASKGQHGRGT